MLDKGDKLKCIINNCANLTKGKWYIIEFRVDLDRYMITDDFDHLSYVTEYPFDMKISQRCSMIDRILK